MVSRRGMQTENLVIGHRTILGEAKPIASFPLWKVNGGSDLSSPL